MKTSILKSGDSEVQNGGFWIVSFVTGILFYVTLFLLDVPVDSILTMDTSDVSISVAYYIENALPANMGFLYYVILVIGLLSFFLPLGSVNGIILIVLSMVLDKTIIISQAGLIDDVTVVVVSTSIMILMGVIMILLGLLQLLTYHGIGSFIRRKTI